MSEVRPLTSENVCDARDVILSRFSESALNVLDLVMRNPLRKECPEAGDVVYDQGRAVCFRAGILRSLYLGQRKLRGKVRGLTCVRKDARPEVVVDMQMAERRNSRGSSMAYSNSQCAETEQMARIMRYKPGPKPCTRYLWRPIRPLACLSYIVQRKIIRKAHSERPDFDMSSCPNFKWRDGEVEILRMTRIDSAVFDCFFEEYLRTNEGLVSSRTAEELQWIFGNRISNGQVVVLVAMKSGEPIGYVFLTGGSDARQWRILDLIALGNDRKVLEVLLTAACVFLRKHTPAIMLKSFGFPDWVQPTLKKYLPHERSLGVNTFSYNYPDRDFGKECDAVILTEKSWFFGPYDGDYCFG